MSNDSPNTDSTFTIDQFCAAERISRSLLYKLWQQGQGPRFYCVGLAAASLPKQEKSGDGN